MTISEKKIEGKIYVFPSGDFHETLNDIRNDIQKDNVKAASIIWMDKNEKDIYYNHIGDSVENLGLLIRLQHVIQRYIDALNDE